MTKNWAITGMLLLAAAAFTTLGCSPETPDSPDQRTEETAPAEIPSETAVENGAPTGPAAIPNAESAVDIDIGDVTYGVYANIEVIRQDIAENMEVTRLSSPRFDQRTQLLTIDMTPPYPETFRMFMILGSTRPLTGHTVYMKIHTFREYTDENGENVTEEILSYDKVLGGMRLVTTPEAQEFEAFEGLEKLPSTMLLYSELEAWLFLNTDVETFDPETADFTAADYKRYSGFNPARINLLSSESQE